MDVKRSFCRLWSVRKPLSRLGQLRLRLLDVSPGRVQILVPQYPSQAHQIAGIRFQVLVSKCVPEQVWVQLDADYDAVLVAQGSDAPICERPTFPKEDKAGLHRRANLQICGQSTPSRKRQRD